MDLIYSLSGINVYFLSDDRFDHPASQPRVGECAHVEGTTSHAPSTGMIYYYSCKAIVK